MNFNLKAQQAAVCPSKNLLASKTGEVGERLITAAYDRIKAAFERATKP